jgi:transposase
VKASNMSLWKITDEQWCTINTILAQKNEHIANSPIKNMSTDKKTRRILEGIVYALRTNCTWKSLPLDRFGHASAIEATFSLWQKEGIFDLLHTTTNNEIRHIAYLAKKRTS